MERREEDERRDRHEMKHIKAFIEFFMEAAMTVVKLAKEKDE